MKYKISGKTSGCVRPKNGVEVSETEALGEPNKQEYAAVSQYRTSEGRESLMCCHPLLTPPGNGMTKQGSLSCIMQHLHRSLPYMDRR